ncbi:MAG: AmmeMemoRadiSam system protein B [Candidatus Zixiibacteriota bacterium]
MDDRKLDIRKPAVAGKFYPANPVELTKTIASFFAEVDKTPVGGRPLGLIAPHAGYPYSGKVAAKAYKILEGEEFDTVVVISPSHTVFFKGSSVYGGHGYETPIGVVETDHDMAKKIAGINPSSVYFSNMGHASGSVRGEHALEVQLPFLQIVLGSKFKLVAIVMGDQETDSIRSLGEALAAALKGSNALLVASTDLSHFHSEKQARRLDFAIQSAIEKYDPDLLMETLESGKGEACGGGPVTSVMMAAKKLGGREVRFLDYTTSGATTGDFDEVVGYLSAAIIKENRERHTTVLGSPAAKAVQPEGFSEDDKHLLHQIARDAIAAKLEEREYQPPSNERLSARKGAFVTLTLDGNLRGCIGQIRTKQPLYSTVAEMAVAAAFDDPRFDPLTADEFKRLEYEISVLSPLERVRNFREILIGRDGLMIKLDMHSGLLLPQVATEHGWNVTHLLEQTCLKAGLPKHSYKDRQAEIYRFSADVF